MLDSRVDKVGVVIVLMSACCWVGYTAGFIVRIQQSEHRVKVNENSNIALSLECFCQWSFLVSGVLLYLTTFVHIIYGWNMCSTFLLVIFTPVNFVTGGGVLNVDGIALYNYYTRGKNMEISFDDFLPVEFAGTLLALLFYWVFLSMWILSVQHRTRSDRIKYDIIT